MIRGWLILCASLMLAAGFTGCAMGPDFKTPATPAVTPKTFQHAGLERYVKQDRWWSEFGDPELDKLVEQALSRNWNLKLATAKVLEVQALFTSAQAQRYPSLDLTAGANKNQSVETRSGDRITENYNLSLAASFELDLWGRLSRTAESARADLLQTEESRRTVAQTLIAQVVTSYLKIESLERRIAVQQRSIRAFGDSRDLVEGRYKRGLSSVLDLRQSRRAFLTAQAQLPTLRLDLAREQQALSVLAGDYPKSSPERVQPLDYFPNLKKVPAGLPSEILLRRPDLRSATAKLKSLNAKVGAARANRFPKISLTGNLGYATTELDALVTPAGLLWKLAAGLAQPVFDAGQLEAQERAARARLQQGVAEWAQTALSAFSEVENALVSRELLMKQRALVKETLKEAIATMDAAQFRYTRGLTDYLRVLEAQRTRYDAEESLILVELAILTNRVGLHRALGGGWDGLKAVETQSAPLLRMGDKI